VGLTRGDVKQVGQNAIQGKGKVQIDVRKKPAAGGNRKGPLSAERREKTTQGKGKRGEKRKFDRKDGKKKQPKPWGPKKRKFSYPRKKEKS